MSQQRPTIPEITLKEESITTRIEKAFDGAMYTRAEMLAQGLVMDNLRENAKVQLGEEYLQAKNNDVRNVLILTMLATNEEFQKARVSYRLARDSFKLHMLEIMRLRVYASVHKF